MNVIGEVKGRTCLILDDIIDTAGTLVKTADALLAQGAAKVYACASHAVLSGPAVDRIKASRLEQVVVANTIPLHQEARKLEESGKIKFCRSPACWDALSKVSTWRPAFLRSSTKTSVYDSGQAGFFAGFTLLRSD